MKTAVVVLVCMVAFVGALVAAEDEVTLKGEIVCAKCSLKVPGIAKCELALQVKDGDKTTTCLLAGNDVRRKMEKDLWEKDKKNWCKESTAVTAVGAVKEADGKKILTAAKLEKIAKKKAEKKAA